MPHLRDRQRHGRRAGTLPCRVPLLLAVMTGAGCGSSGDPGGAGRERFEQARRWYDKEFSTIDARPDAPGGPGGTTAATTKDASRSAPPGTPASAAARADAGAAAGSPLPSAPTLAPAASAPVSAPALTPVPAAQPSPLSLAALVAARSPAAAAPAMLALAQAMTGGGSAARPGAPGAAGTGVTTAQGSGVAAGTVPGGALDPALRPADPTARPGGQPLPPGGADGGGAPDGPAQGEIVPGSATPAPAATLTPAPTPALPADSDSVPPVVAGIRFDPESAPASSRVSMIVTASDDRAGAESARGQVIGPSGQRAYFSLSADASQTVLTGSIKVPPEAEGGVWTVQVLTLTDRARNSASYTPADDPIVRAARFTVEGRGGDTEPPALLSISLAPAEVADGSQVRVSVAGKDDKSALQTVRGTLQSPSGAVQQPWSAALNKATGQFEGAVRIPPHAESGEWRVGQLVLIDSAKNRLTIDAPDSRIDGARVKVTSSEDKVAPTLSSIGFAPPRVHPPAAAALDIVAADAVSGVRSATGLIQMASSQSPLPFTGQRFAPGQFRALLDVPNPAPLGTWKVLSLTLSDHAGNQVTLPASDPMLAGATLEVQ